MQARTLDFKTMNSFTGFEHTKITNIGHAPRGQMDNYIT